HTFGHAFERCSGYRLRHGEAVAVGLVAAAELAERLGRATPGLAARVEACLARLGLPTCLPGYDPAAVRAAMSVDKKRRGATLRFVICEEPGRAALIDDPGHAVDAALARVLGRPSEPV
ncbi:MAG: 3-dehydroquinate synthase, partial [Planctomycetota bacterium]